MKQKRVRQRFFRICKGCEQRYTPIGKAQGYCENCLRKIRMNNLKKLFKSRGIKFEA